MADHPEEAFDLYAQASSSLGIASAPAPAPREPSAALPRDYCEGGPSETSESPAALRGGDSEGKW